MADSGGEKVSPDSLGPGMLRNEVFVLRGYGGQLIGVLNEWRQSKTYCDVNISINDSNFSLHRCVLAAGSRKFHEILHSINPSSTACLSFDGMPTDGFSHVIDYLYTGKICLNHLLVKDVLKSARFLQVEEVANLCKLYLRRQYMPSDRSEVRVDVSAREQDNVKQAASEVIFELKEVFETPAPQPKQNHGVLNGFPEDGKNGATPPSELLSTQPVEEEHGQNEDNSMTVSDAMPEVGSSREAPGTTTVQKFINDHDPEMKQNMTGDENVKSCNLPLNMIEQVRPEVGENVKTERGTEIESHNVSHGSSINLEHKMGGTIENMIPGGSIPEGSAQIEHNVLSTRGTELLHNIVVDQNIEMEQTILADRDNEIRQDFMGNRSTDMRQNVMEGRITEMGHSVVNQRSSEVGHEMLSKTSETGRSEGMAMAGFEHSAQAAETQVNQTLMDLAQAAIESYQASCTSPGPFSNISSTDNTNNLNAGQFSTMNCTQSGSSIDPRPFSGMSTNMNNNVNSMDQGPLSNISSVDSSTNNIDILPPRSANGLESGSMPESGSRDGHLAGGSDHESDSGGLDDTMDSGELDRSSDSFEEEDEMDNITVKVEERDAFGLSELDSTGLTPSLLELLKKHALLQQPAPGKRRRGRPRKNPIPLRVPLKRPAPPPAPGKRKRGRPRKIRPEEMVLEPKQEIDDKGLPVDELKEEHLPENLEESDMFDDSIIEDDGSELDFMLSSDEEYGRKPRRRRGRKPKAKKAQAPLPILPPGVVRRGRPRKGEVRLKGPKNCEKCKRMFEHSRDLVKHMEHHDKDQLTFCPICNWGFQRKGELTKHCRAHSGESYRCDDCNQDYINPREFKNHMLRLHDNPRPFFCKHPDCNFRSDRPSNVDNHAILHSGLKTVLCPQCGKAFAHPNSLYSHRKSCLQQRGYLCDICGSKFNHFQSLQSHRRLHTGEKPFWCHSCGKGFADRMNYKRHRRIHENLYPYPCPVCDKRFRHSNSLKAHMNRHNPGMAPAVVQAQPMPRVAAPASGPPPQHLQSHHLQSQPQTPTQPQSQPQHQAMPQLSHQPQHAQPHNMHIPPHPATTPTPTQSHQEHLSPLFSMAHISHPHAPQTPTPISHPHPPSTPTPTHHHQSSMSHQPGPPHLVHHQAPMSPGPIPMNQHHMHHPSTPSPAPTPLPAHTPLSAPNYQRLMPVPVTSAPMGVQPYNPHNVPTSGTHPAMPVFNYGPPDHPFFPGMQAF